MPDLCMTTHERSIKSVLEASVGFADWVSKARNATRSIQRVHLNDLPEPEDCEGYEKDEYLKLCPYAIVGHVAFTLVYDAHETYFPVGTVAIRLEERHEDRKAAAAKKRTKSAFKVSLDWIMEDIGKASEGPVGYQADEIRVENPIVQTSPIDEIPTLGYGWKSFIIMPLHRTTDSQGEA